MNSLESQRRKTANIVIALAKLAEDHDDLLNLLDAKFGDLDFLSEEGCFRAVYELPNKLVLKLCNHEQDDHHRHNLVEYRLSKTYPDYVARTYGRHRKGAVDVLVSRRSWIALVKSRLCEKASATEPSTRSFRTRTG